MSSAVSQTSVHHWKYVAEGGSTIVFSYSGPQNLFFDGKVLRLRKSQITAAESGAPGDLTAMEEFNDPSVDFQQQVIRYLVPARFLPHLAHVQVERDWLESMMIAHEHLRPSHRRDKDIIDLRRSKAVLSTDLIGNTGLAVEIKPKWGFLPEPTYLSKHSRPIKTRICRFCMKKNTDPDGFRLAYCPLDLYSESEERRRFALNALWDDWLESHGTMNMLRIFVNGKVLDPSSDPWATILAREIQHDKHTVLELREKFVSILVSILQQQPVLSTLKRLQRTLDPLDIEGLSRLCSECTTDDYPHSLLPLPTGPIIADPDLQEWSSFLDTYSRNKPFGHVDPGKSNQRYHLLAYLLSATFKDCSIIIRVHGDNVESATVTIIDVDAKSLDRLGRWEALDRQVLAASTTDTRICVDSSINS